MHLMNTQIESPYPLLTEEEIVIMAKTGDVLAEEYIIKKYKGFVRVKARSYFLIGADREDIVQEGMIGLFKAIRDFQLEKSVNFKTFAEICVTRQMITAVKSATRQKHIPLNSYISLSKPIFEEDSEKTLLDVLHTRKNMNPETLVISKEKVEAIENKIYKILSDLELEVLNYYLDGRNYQEIAIILNREAKSIDNALQRVKKKLEKNLDFNF